MRSRFAKRGKRTYPEEDGLEATLLADYDDDHPAYVEVIRQRNVLDPDAVRVRVSVSESG